MAGSGLTVTTCGASAPWCAVAMTRWARACRLPICRVGALGSLPDVVGGCAAEFIAAGVRVWRAWVARQRRAKSTMYALCAYVYSTGACATARVGRWPRPSGRHSQRVRGASVITLWGAQGYLTMLGTHMVFALVALPSVRRHFPGQRMAAPVGGVAAAGVSHDERSPGRGRHGVPVWGFAK